MIQERKVSDGDEAMREDIRQLPQNEEPGTIRPAVADELLATLEDATTRTNRGEQLYDEASRYQRGDITLRTFIENRTNNFFYGGHATQPYTEGFTLGTMLMTMQAQQVLDIGQLPNVQWEDVEGMPTFSKADGYKDPENQRAALVRLYGDLGRHGNIELERVALATTRYRVSFDRDFMRTGLKDAHAIYTNAFNRQVGVRVPEAVMAMA